MKTKKSFGELRKEVANRKVLNSRLNVLYKFCGVVVLAMLLLAGINALFTTPGPTAIICAVAVIILLFGALRWFFIKTNKPETRKEKEYRLFAIQHPEFSLLPNNDLFL